MRLLAIMRRQLNPYAATSPSEIVTCRFEDRTDLTVLCKYGATSPVHSYGHRGGAPYEVWVQENILPRLAVGTPIFYGAYTEGSRDRTWLIFEYLVRSARLHLTREPNKALVAAAGWIGRFHAAAANRLSSAELRRLKVYDAEYYRGWALRTSEFARHLHSRFPWLEPLCHAFYDFAQGLAERSTTIIHGEFYPKNVLVQGDRVAPVDWESTARGMGQIDLASLTERWPPDVAAKCEHHYRLARWPDGAPPDLSSALDAARLYLQLRWLGSDRQSTMRQSEMWRFEVLKRIADRLGLI